MSQFDQSSPEPVSVNQPPLGPSARMIKLRYAGLCRGCGKALAKGERAVHHPELKAVSCLQCHSQCEINADAPSAAIAEVIVTGESELEQETAELFERGVPGMSARREYERRVAKDDARLEERFGRISPLVKVFAGERQSTSAWELGAMGEERLGSKLNKICDASAGDLEVLHDRRKPGSKSANIDHIVVSPAAIYVIDAKRYKGRPELRSSGLPWQRKTEFFVSGRLQEKLIEGVLGQAALVREVLGADTTYPVLPVLCFLEADWPPFIHQLEHRGVRIVTPRRMYKIVRESASGPVPVTDIARRLAAALPAN